MCPEHLDLSWRTISPTLSMPKLSKSFSLDFLFFSVTPRIHLSDLITIFYALSNRCKYLPPSRPIVSLPYNITHWNRCWRETVVKTMTHSRPILAVEAFSAQPADPVMSTRLRQQNLLTRSTILSLSLSISISFLPSALASLHHHISYTRNKPHFNLPCLCTTHPFNVND